MVDNLDALGHTSYLPLNVVSFHAWLCDSRKMVPKRQQQGFDTIITLEHGQFRRNVTALSTGNDFINVYIPKKIYVYNKTRYMQTKPHLAFIKTKHTFNH